MANVFKEFKDFAFKGNVIDMAVGVIIGGAFGKIVTSMVSDIFTPFISLLTGKANFSEMYTILKVPAEYANETFATYQEAVDAGCTIFTYGNFIQNIIDFFLIAICIFIFVKLIQTGRKKAAESKKAKEPAAAPAVPAAPTTKKCPYCCSEISIDATKCPHCTSDLPKEN